VRCLFLYPLSPKLQTVGGFTIIPSPPGSLPTIATELQLLEAGVLTQLTDGDLVFVVQTVNLTEAERNGPLPGIAAKLQRQYNGVRVVQELRAKYAHTGRGVDG